MIRKLQKKFIMITMVSLFVVMLILIGLINVINLYSMEKKLDTSINMIANAQGDLPKNIKDDHQKQIIDTQLLPDERNETRFFMVEIATDGTLNQINTSRINVITSTEAQSYALEIFENGDQSGYIDNFKYKMLEESDGYLIIFLYCNDELSMAKKVLLISIIVSLITFLIMFLLVSVFSRRAIKPFIESTEKQKQFITDAGHEIKTPLAIISANADVLELTGGESEWITSIRSQITRLDKLVKNLLMLAKMDEENIEKSFQDLDMSAIIMRMAEPFVAVAETGNKKFEIHVEPGLRLYGEEGSIEQLISSLVDNAMKYSNEGGTIKVFLSRAKSRQGIRLEVFNTTDFVDRDNLDKLFDRFYRPDASRARESGGYGIGLSIARSIVEMHHGKITVTSEDGKSIRFIIIF